MNQFYPFKWHKLTSLKREYPHGNKFNCWMVQIWVHKFIRVNACKDTICFMCARTIKIKTIITNTQQRLFVNFTNCIKLHFHNDGNTIVQFNSWLLWIYWNRILNHIMYEKSFLMVSVSLIYNQIQIQLLIIHQIWSSWQRCCLSCPINHVKLCNKPSQLISFTIFTIIM